MVNELRRDEASALTPEGVQRTPLISMALPVFNEREHLVGCLQSLLEQDYPPDRMEIIVADGCSTDGSRQIADEIAAADARVLVIENPRRVKPVAFNLCVRNARGDLIVWVGAHAEYPPDYLKQMVGAIQSYGADVVGGGVQTVSRIETPFGRAIAVCGGSRVGMAASPFRARSQRPQEVNAVFGGCFRRTLFDEFGLLDERLDRGQDREFFQRLRRAGRRIMYVPEIQCTYFQRGERRGYLAWVFFCGLTPFYISRVTGMRNYVFRNLIPPAFVAALLLLPVLGSALPAARLAWLGLLAVYVCSVGVAGIRARRQLADFKAALLLLPVFFMTHVVYGLGAWYGMVAPLKKGPWARA